MKKMPWMNGFVFLPITTAGYTGTTTAQLTSSGVLTSGATSFLNNQTVGSGKPKAYVNWILFDERFKVVSSNSGFDQVGNDNEFKIHLFNNKLVEKSGYLYIYGKAGHFDQLKPEHFDHAGVELDFKKNNCISIH